MYSKEGNRSQTTEMKIERNLGQLRLSILIVDLLCMSEEPKVSKIKNPVIKSEENRKEGNQSRTTEMKIQNISK